MAKVRILSLSERKAFQLPPLFQSDERIIYFEITDVIKKTVDMLRSTYRKVGFILQWGYFRRTGRFFSPSLFHKQDIIFVSRLLNIDHRSILLENYKEHSLLEDQQKIREIQGFQSFDKHPEAKALLLYEVDQLVSKQIRPKIIIHHLAQYLFHKKIEIPSYQQLAETILKAMQNFEMRLLAILKASLTPSHMKALDSLLPEKNPKKIVDNETYYARASLTVLRDISLSSRPGEIKESICGFLTIKQIFQEIRGVLESLSLSQGSLKYYAVWAQKAKITQLVQLKNPFMQYLYLLTFVAHQYYSRQDLFVDTLLQSVQTVLNTIEKKQNEEDKNTKREREHATHMLSMSYRDKTDLLTKIYSVVNTDGLSAEEKVTQIKLLMGEEETPDPSIMACIEKLNEHIEHTLNDDYFYNVLEKQSVSLQNKLSNIVKCLDFHAMSATSPLLEAINYFKDLEKSVDNNAPIHFLEPQDIAHLRDDKGKIRPSLYKALLFIKIASVIKSGEINLHYSYRYLSIDEYLIDKTAWARARQEYLARAELSAYSTLKETMVPLRKKLEYQYHKTNESISNGTNPHVSFNEKGDVIVDTPKVEKIETERIAELLKQKNYVSILEVLDTIDNITNFSDCLQHYSVIQKIKRPNPIVFYAGLMGKGCNIGLGKLASVSKGINGNTLETVVNWYFSNDHLMAANNRIIRFINKLTLPNLMKKTLGKLHTSSDGQKRNVDMDSVLANFSFKYHGSGRGVSIYDFIDERHVLFHSLVMSSSEREAAYVIDGLMCNDEIKSDIHSTDTHGYSDLIFAITHLLSISFAPRLAKLKKRTLYSIETRKTYKKKGYQILPDNTINMRLIEDNWEDILRLVATIKLKEATASQILKRLSSYARDNPLYQGLKEFGKLIKTIFLLTYMDDLALRQAIQKQLNKIELANKFSDAVFFDNNQEFKQGTREEQELAMNCKILLQNAILLWNYLYLSQLLATANATKRSELLKIITNGSIMTWLHINLLGEYDFRNKPASNELIFDIEKIMAWSA